ncbi:MAG: Maf family protein [Candidatus Eisenbacteria bacterium]
MAAVPLGALWPPLPGPLGLVSSSPRRAALLRAIGVPFRVIRPREGAEGAGAGPPEEIVLLHAEAKARSAGGDGTEAVLLAADTVVVREGRTLGKPGSEVEAGEMLRFLSGGPHDVITGVYALDRRSGRASRGIESTRVVFRSLSAEEIDSYVATGEPADKAGAYGVQGIGGLLVARIEGCYFNVVGLPLVRAAAVLRELLEGGEA